MTRDQFRRLAETWGSDIARWPVATQVAARAFAATEDGAAVLDEQRGFDQLFATAPEVARARAQRASLAVLHRIAQAPEAQPWYRRLLQPVSMIPATSLACSALMGIWLAGALPYYHSNEALSVVSMLFDSSVISPWGMQ